MGVSGVGFTVTGQGGLTQPLTWLKRPVVRTLVRPLAKVNCTQVNCTLSDLVLSDLVLSDLVLSDLVLSSLGMSDRIRSCPIQARLIP